MWEETLKTLKRWLIQGDQGPLLRVPNEPAHVYHLFDGESWSRVEAETEDETDPRSHYLHTLNDLIKAVEIFGGEKTQVFVQGSFFPVHTESTVCVVLDNVSRLKHQLRHVLRSSGQWMALVDLPLTFTQRELIKFLRIDLNGAHGLEAAIDQFRQIKFGKNEAGGHSIQNSRETVDMAIEHEMTTGGNPVPHLLKVRVNPFDNLFTESGSELYRTKDICMDVDVDLKDATFRLTPLGGEMYAAMVDAMNYVVSQLKELQCPIFLGAP